MMLAGEGLLFLTLAIVSTAPTARHIHSHLPIGAERSGAVALLNLWTIGWNVDRLSHGYRGYWDAPMYFPARGTLALSEPLTVAGALAWPLWRVLPSAVSVYNTLLFLFLALNGWVGCALLKRLGVAWPAALVGGALLTLLPLIHWQLGVFQLTGLWGVCWTLCALHGARRQARLRDGLHLGLAFSCTYLLCCYYGLMLSMLLLPCAGLWCGRRLRSGRFLSCLGVALATAAVLLGPIVAPQIMVARHYPSAPALATIRELSVSPADYLITPGRQWLPLPSRPRTDGHVAVPMSPGTLKFVLAGVGVVWGWRTRRHRRLVAFLAGMALLAMLLSMGPRLHWRGHSPYTVLAACYPGLSHARNLFRFAFFVQLSVVLLAAVGVHGLYRLARQRLRGGAAWRAGAALMVITLGVVLALEAWPPPTRLFAVPSAAVQAGWIEWLRSPPQARVRLICFPLAPGRSADDHLQTTVWMYYQLFHWRPLANGYSAVIPDSYTRLERALAGGPDASGLAALREAGITHCLFDAPAGAAADAAALRALGCALVVDDHLAGVQIWRLPGDDP